MSYCTTTHTITIDQKFAVRIPYVRRYVLLVRNNIPKTRALVDLLLQEVQQIAN